MSSPRRRVVMPDGEVVRPEDVEDIWSITIIEDGMQGGIPTLPPASWRSTTTQKTVLAMREARNRQLAELAALTKLDSDGFTILGTWKSGMVRGATVEVSAGTA